MSSLIEWVKALEAPGGVLLGIAGKSWFDRAKNKREEGLSEAQESKLDSETAKTFAEAAAILVEPLSRQIAELNSRVDKLERENILLRSLLAQHAPHLTLSLELDN